MKHPLLIGALVLGLGFSFGWPEGASAYVPGTSGLEGWWAQATGGRRRAIRIVSFARRWLGTPYQWGGTSRRGIDCSAYLRQMFRKLFRVELPRTTKQQIHLGIDLPINPRRLSRGLHPGDLIFYIGRDGRPNHVVVYAGKDTITHSVSGRGVVIDPIRKVYGRRIVARRVLVPRRNGDDDAGFAPIPAAGPIVPKEIPCPDNIQARPIEVRRYARKPIEDLKPFGERAICDLRALADALEKKRTAPGRANALKLRDHAIWMESIEALKGEIGRGW